MSGSRNFQLRVPINAASVMWYFVGVLGMSGFVSFLLYQRVLAYQGEPLQILGLTLSALALVALVTWTLYLYRLSELKGPAIIFGEKEWKDSVSLFCLGHRQLRDLHSAGLKTFFGVPVLELHLEREVLGGAHRGLLKRIYAFCLGSRLLIPLSFLDISRLDLESQFLHLQKIIAHNHRSPEAVMDDEETFLGVREHSIYTRLDKLSSRSGSGEARPKNEHPVVAEVNRRKADFFRKGLGNRICDLFTEHLRELHTQDHADIPPGLELVKHRSEGDEYEEVSFFWQKRDYQIGLRTNLGEGTEASLSLAYRNEVKVALKVDVEIGALEPRDVNRYIPGEDWERGLLSLEEAFKRPSSKSSSGQAPQNERLKSQKIEELKRNFGLKDD